MPLTPEEEEAARQLQERLARDKERTLEEIQAKDPKGDHRNTN